MNSIPFHPKHIDSKSAGMSMSHFLFPPTLFARGFCQIGNEQRHGHEDPTRDKTGKSFTIDSLLGLSNAAARAVLQSGISHHHQSAINLANSIRSDCWRFENEYDYSSEISEQSINVNSEPGNLRFHPYNNVQPISQSQSQPNSVTATTTFAGRPTKVSNPNSKKNSHSCVPDKASVDTTQIIRRAAKTKRVRTIFTPEQLERLEAEFERQQYMVGPERLYLASSLNLTEAQVKVWFQNRRIKWRKQHFELQQQRLAVLRSQQTELEDEDSGSEFGSTESLSPNAISVEFEPEINANHKIQFHKERKRK